MHRSPEKQIEPHQLLGFQPHCWFSSVSSKTRQGSEKGTRTDTFSPQNVNENLGLSPTPFSASRFAWKQTCNNSHIHPCKKAEGEVLEEPGYIWHLSISFNPLLTPSLPELWCLSQPHVPSGSGKTTEVYSWILQGVRAIPVRRTTPPLQSTKEFWWSRPGLRPRFLPRKYLRTTSWPLGQAEGHRANIKPAQC